MLSCPLSGIFNHNILQADWLDWPSPGYIGDLYHAGVGRSQSFCNTCTHLQTLDTSICGNFLLDSMFPAQKALRPDRTWQWRLLNIQLLLYALPRPCSRDWPWQRSYTGIAWQMLWAFTLLPPITHCCPNQSQRPLAFTFSNLLC